MTSPSDAAWWRRNAAPRDVGEAVRIGALMLACAGGVILLKSVSSLVIFGPWFASGRHQDLPTLLMNTVVVPAALFGTAAWGRVRGIRHPLIAGLPVPLAALTLTGVTNTLTQDASAGSQMFLVLPVLYAAYFLRPVAAAVVTVWAAAMALMTFGVVDPDGSSSLVYFATALGVTALMIARAQKVAHEAEADLQHMASLDALTGLSTRRVLDEAAARALHGPPREPVSLMVLDVDLFKDINDALGHPGGDAALVAVAEHLRVHAGAGDIVSRLGGDEFAVLMVGCSPLDAAARAEGIVRGARFREPGPGARFTFSAGLAHAPGDAQDVDALYVVADRRMYAAKNAGRDRLVGTGD